MNNMSKFISFVLGAAVGSAATFVVVSKKYQAMYEEDVASVKEELGKKKTAAEDIKEKCDEVEAPVTAKPVAPVKPSIMEYKKTVEEEGYTDYTKHEVNPAKPRPRVIPIQEFGADEDYDVITLYWTADDVLVDEDGEKIKNVPETVGGSAIVAIKELASDDDEDADDSIYVINEERETYYEILLSLKTSDEF